MNFGAAWEFHGVATILLEMEIPINGNFGADGRTPLTEPPS
jgi:hypothetical protein